MNLRVRKWVFQVVFLVCLAVIIAMTASVLRTQRATLNRINEKNQQLALDKADALLELQGTQRMLEYAKSDEYVEQKARQIFDWVRPDEYLIVDEDAYGAASPNDLLEIQNAHRIATELERAAEVEELDEQTDQADPVNAVELDPSEAAEMLEDQPEPSTTKKPETQQSESYEDFAASIGIPDENG